MRREAYSTALEHSTRLRVG